MDMRECVCLHPTTSENHPASTDVHTHTRGFHLSLTQTLENIPVIQICLKDVMSKFSADVKTQHRTRIDQ